MGYGFFDAYNLYMFEGLLCVYKLRGYLPTAGFLTGS